MVSNPEIDVLGAQSECFEISDDGAKKIIRQKINLQGGWMDLKEVISWSQAGVFAFIETWFMRRQVFDHAGYLDLKYRVATDTDFAFRLIKSGVKFFVRPECILQKYHYHDGSNNISNLDVMLREHREIILRHAGTRPFAWWALYRWPYPLHSRIFWSAWLSIGKALRHSFPVAYRALQRVAGRAHESGSRK